MIVMDLAYEYINQPNDPRTTTWPLISSFWPMFVILFSYYYFVKQCGPRYMENRKPWDLKTFIWYYNVFQILVNAWIVYRMIGYGMFSDIGIGCEPVNRSPEGKPYELAKMFYWTMLVKIVDLVETAVFVLRKKNRQISFLHMYHHISTVYLAWASVKHYPGGMATFPVVVNSTVHVIMYTYYLLSSKGPSWQKILNPIKPYITIIQMVQFFILLGHSLQGFVPSCQVPKWGASIMFINLVINFLLFYNFYRKNYKPKAKKS